MSETKQKPWTGTPECGDPEHFYNSETGYVECNTCSRPAEPVIEVAPGGPTIKSVRLIPGTIHGTNYGPPPNIAVGWLPGVNVPAVPATCEYCGPVCYRGAEHNARVEDGARYTDDPVPAVPETWDTLSRQCTLAAKDGKIPDELYDRALAARERENRPAVPAQEAPRECNYCGTINHVGPCPYKTVPNPYGLFPQNIPAMPKAEPQAGAQPVGVCVVCDGVPAVYKPGGWRCLHCANQCEDCDDAVCRKTKPGPCDCSCHVQAGAQVPSQDEIPASRVVELSKLYVAVALNTEIGSDETRLAATATVHALAALEQSRIHLNTIRNYVIEAAKTPITREDMHDPLKAQTFYDEHEGFIRLVLSEIGGGL